MLLFLFVLPPAKAISDSILTSFYRYLCGYGDALLYDPALHRAVYALMTKLFKRLVGHLRRLGVRVVFASFSRIILHTNKYELDAAREYTHFILETLKTHEIFGDLVVSVQLTCSFNIHPLHCHTSAQIVDGHSYLSYFPFLDHAQKLLGATVVVGA